MTETTLKLSDQSHIPIEDRATERACGFLRGAQKLGQEVIVRRLADGSYTCTVPGCGYAPTRILPGGAVSFGGPLETDPAQAPN